MSATHGRVSIPKLILVPALISLAITILRLVGELQDWSPIFFNRAAGGGFAVVGIWWLAIVFGAYFALKQMDAGEGPRSKGAAILFAVLGIVLAFLGAFVGISPAINFPGKIVVSALLVLGAAILPLRGWPALGKTLLAYAYARAHPGSDRYVLRDTEELGHALRRSAAEHARILEHTGQVPTDRVFPSDVPVDCVHGDRRRFGGNHNGCYFPA